MNAAPASLADARREQLRLRCAQQRQQLHEAITDVQSQLHGLDRGVLMMRKLRLGPALIAIGAAAVSTLPVFRHLNRALLLLRTFRSLKGLLPSR